jgi:hypothetical protein
MAGYAAQRKAQRRGQASMSRSRDTLMWVGAAGQASGLDTHQMGAIPGSVTA